MNKSPSEWNIIRFTKALEKFMHSNENWFQKPEHRIQQFEKEMAEWNTHFLQQMNDVESWIKELEKKME